MHSFTKAMVLGMTVAATARPGRPARNLAKRQADMCILDTVIAPSPDQTVASINQWNDDVNTVNSFLNDVASGAISTPSDLLSRAQGAFTSASDEPCQLGTLGSLGVIVTGAFDCARQDLMNVFQTDVLDNLSTIINNVNDTATVQTAVDGINQIRCCNVLPDASILFLDAAFIEGVSDRVQTCANREDACSSVVCPNGLSCQSDNDGIEPPTSCFGGL